MRFYKYSSDERKGVLRRPINQIHHGPTIRRERNIAPVVMNQIKGLELAQLQNAHRSDHTGSHRLKSSALRLSQRQKDFHTITRRCHLMSPVIYVLNLRLILASATVLRAAAKWRRFQS